MTILRPEADRLKRRPSCQNRPQILVVDDDWMSLTLVSDALSLLGYPVLAHSSSVQALARFRTDPFSIDLVLTDFNMPGLNGLDLSRKLLQLQPELPILLMTGGGPALDDGEVLRSGLRALLKKPFSIVKLEDAIRDALVPNGMRAAV